MMRKFAAEDLPPKGRFHYHQGVFLSGVYQTYLLNGNERYYEYVKRWVDYEIDENGDIKQWDRGQPDDMQPGILLFPLYAKERDSRYKKALDEICPTILSLPRNKVGGMWHKTRYPDQMWLDGLYMAGPLCCEYALKFDKPEYFDFVSEQAKLMEKYTRDERNGLWRHAWDESKKAEWANPDDGRSPEIWGRAMGWAALALLNDLDFMPEGYKNSESIKAEAVRLITALIAAQPDGGRWYQVVDKPDAPGNWPENSCSCLYVAAICKAARLGYIGSDALISAKKGFLGVIGSLKYDSDDLLLGDVCVGTGVGDYDHYINRPTSVNDLHGVGAFLLMCAEAERVGLFND